MMSKYKLTDLKMDVIALDLMEATEGLNSSLVLCDDRLREDVLGRFVRELAREDADLVKGIEGFEVHSFLDLWCTVEWDEQDFIYLRVGLEDDEREIGSSQIPGGRLCYLVDKYLGVDIDERWGA